MIAQLDTKSVYTFMGNHDYRKLCPIADDIGIMDVDNLYGQHRLIEIVSHKNITPLVGWS